MGLDEPAGAALGTASQCMQTSQFEMCETKAGVFVDGIGSDLRPVMAVEPANLKADLFKV